MPRPDQLSQEIEKLFGRITADALTGASGIEDDPLLLRWVQQLGQAVAAQSDRKELPPQFLILGNDVANALTLPGSKVFVTRGLLDEVTSEDELVGVLAHEAGHVAKRHAWQQMVGSATFLLALTLVRPKSRELRLGATVVNVLRTLAQSRSNEYQADEVGVGFAAAAGYHPQGLIQFIERLAARSGPWWEEYFETHPPGPKRAERGRHFPLVARTDPDSRASVAAGLDQRSLPALAELTRRGGDPLQLPALPRTRVPDALVAEQTDVRRRAEQGLQRLQRTYRPLAIDSTLQQLLLLTAQTTDLRFIALSTHAYLLMFKIQDIYARQVRLLRAAPGVWDGLVPESVQGPLDGRLGRDEVVQALLASAGTADPLHRATEAATVALTDLNVGRFYRLSSTGQWGRIAVVEGLILYAERELVRADHASSEAWHLLAQARVRRYQARLNVLVPESAELARLRWRAVLERRLGTTVQGTGPTGDATIRAAVALQQNQTESEVQEQRKNSRWTDWVARNHGIPENIATMMRLLTLELERELAADAFLASERR